MYSNKLLRIAKRLFDLTAAALILLALAPAFLFIAAAIGLDSPGPVFFRQKRLGLNVKVFSIFKFRTMIPNAVSAGAGLVTFDGDPRVTRVGRTLRKFRLDELPQLFNVLLGQMSLVGPRPLLPDYLSGYSERDMLRLWMPPGMTGWQQINGGATHTWSERVESDIWYIGHWSPWLDIKILLKTPLVVLKADTVHGKDGWQLSGGPEEMVAQKEAA